MQHDCALCFVLEQWQGKTPSDFVDSACLAATQRFLTCQYLSIMTVGRENTKMQSLEAFLPKAFTSKPRQHLSDSGR